VTPDPIRALHCDAAAPLLVFYVCGESSPEDCTALEQHIAGCASCAAALASELRLRQVLTTLAQPADVLDQAGALLAQCRSELAEALDDAEDAKHEFRPRVGFSRWFAKYRMELALHPALAAAIFVLFGLGLGRMLPAAQILGTQQAGLVPGMTVSATPRISNEELQNMAVSGISVVPNDAAGSPTIELHLRSMKPVTIEGRADDTDVKRVLSYVIANGQRFDSGVRLDSIEVLRSRVDDTDVRHVLCAAALHDVNPAVRLGALEALQGASQDSTVRDALLDVLAHDDNAGVRIVAMNDVRALVDAGQAAGDAHVRDMLRTLSERDSNQYIRLQAASAVRRLDGGPLP